MTAFRIIRFTTEMLDEVLDNLFVLRPPVDRARLAEEFTTCDAVLVYDRPDSNPLKVLAHPAYCQQTWDDGRGDVPLLTREVLAGWLNDGPAPPTDQADPALAGWLIVARRQLDLLNEAQESRQNGQPVNLALLANLLDDAGKGAPAIVPPTPAQLARPRWGGTR